MTASSGPATRQRLAGRILDLAFPPTCPGCGREGSVLCPTCATALTVRRGVLPGAALGMPSTVPLPLLQLEWCAPFAGVVRSALHALKYAGERRLAEPLGAAMADRWREAGAGGDLLCPVPVHESRRRDRGYDQAELLATVAAGRLGLPCRSILVRTRATERQFALDRADRAENVAGAFIVAAGGAARPGEADAVDASGRAGRGRRSGRGSVGRPRRRRGDDRRDAGRLCERPPGGRCPRGLGAHARPGGVTGRGHAGRLRATPRLAGSSARAPGTRPESRVLRPVSIGPDAGRGRRRGRAILGRPPGPIRAARAARASPNPEEVRREDDRHGQEHRRP